MTTDDDARRPTESRTTSNPVFREADPVDEFGTRIGRTVALVVSAAAIAWIVLYVMGKI